MSEYCRCGEDKGFCVDCMKEEIDSLRSEREAVLNNAISIALGTPCDSHSGDNTPSFGWFSGNASDCVVCIYGIVEAADRLMPKIRTVHLDMGGKHKYHLPNDAYKFVEPLRQALMAFHERRQKNA